MASPCPTVMIALDISGSMNQDPMGGGTSPSKLDIAKQAITRLMSNYGTRVPFGLTTFFEGQCAVGAGDGIVINPEPKDGTGAQVAMIANAAVAGGSTNTAYAIKKIAADPAMHDATRPGSYILLITDGEPNCNGDPQISIDAISAALSASQPIKTFVVGFGALPANDKMVLDQMAAAGGVPCSDATLCAPHQFYVADTATTLNAAIDSITSQVAGEFSGMCDDSCYSNGCSNANQICVGANCIESPCAAIKNTCAPGDYCFTDGKSAMCTKTCPMTCPAGQMCTTGGVCVADPCSQVTCPTGQTCSSGQCVTDTCSARGCATGLTCLHGTCVDDPCHYVTTADAPGCPMGTACIVGIGACVGTPIVNPPPTNRGHGCAFGGASTSELAAAALLLVTAILLRARRRARS
jgi:hypothetical protein